MNKHNIHINLVPTSDKTYVVEDYLQDDTHLKTKEFKSNELKELMTNLIPEEEVLNMTRKLTRLFKVSKIEIQDK